MWFMLAAAVNATYDSLVPPMIYDTLIPPELLEAADKGFDALAKSKMKNLRDAMNVPPGFLSINEELAPSPDDLIASLTYWVVHAIPEVASIRSGLKIVKWNTQDHPQEQPLQFHMDTAYDAPSMVLHQPVIGVMLYLTDEQSSHLTVLPNVLGCSGATMQNSSTSPAAPVCTFDGLRRSAQPVPSHLDRGVLIRPQRGCLILCTLA